MKTQNGWFKRTALLILLMVGSSSASAFPEIPFCPLGGPPGWLNRMTDDDDHRYYPPPYYPPLLMTPYWQQASPYPYSPQYPVYQGYPHR